MGIGRGEWRWRVEREGKGRERGEGGDPKGLFRPHVRNPEKNCAYVCVVCVYACVTQVCLVLLLAVVVISLSLFTSLMHHGDWLSSTADDGGWHDFSHSSSLLFYVYSAFLVDDGPSRDVIRLIAITSPVEWFADQQTDVLCVVRYSHSNLTHVASIVQRLPKVISEPDYVGWLWRKVADYVYTCPLPANQRQRHLVPVSITYWLTFSFQRRFFLIVAK